MNTRQKQKIPASPQSRKPAKKHLPLRRRFTVRFRGAQRNHGRLPTPRPKRLRRGVALNCRGEADRPRIAQHPILSRQPINLFLEMLQRKGPLEIRVQHAVRKYNIGKPPTHHAVAAVAMVLPQTMDHHSIEPRQIFPHPGLQPGCPAIAPLRRPQCVYRETLSLNIVRTRIIQAHHFHRAHTALRKFANRLGRSSRRRRKTMPPRAAAAVRVHP